MFENMSRRKKTVALVFGFLIIEAVVIVALILLSHCERNYDTVPEGAGTAPNRAITPRPAEKAASGDGIHEELETIFYNGQEYAYNDNLSTLLILGIDDVELIESASSRNTSQADMILLAVFDSNRESCTLLQINRDTMTDVPVLDSFGKLLRYQVEQIALAHTYGNGLEKSCENTVDAVSRFLYDIKIDNYFAFTMDAIPIINDLVGGVTVTVEDDFSDVDSTLIKGTTVKLTAENVEHFVRTRREISEDPTNINRMRRQAVYLTGLASEMRNELVNDESFVIDAYAALTNSMVTDCSVEQMSEFGERFSGYALSGIITPVGDSIGGEKYMEFYVDEEELKLLVLELFYLPLSN